MQGRKGWILYRKTVSEMDPVDYEIQRLLEVAEKHQIELEVLKPEQFDLLVSRDDAKSILLNGTETGLPDFVLPRLGADSTYFALAVMRQMERLGIRVINSSEAIEQAKDKLYTQQILAASDLPVPLTMLLKHPVNAELIEKRLRFPAVIKTLSGSKGSGVFLAANRMEFQDLMDLIASTQGNANIIVQEFIEQSRGRDLRVFVLGGRVLACMQRYSESGSFKANVSRGAEVKPYEVTPEIEWLAIETARILNLDIAGIDLLFNGESFMVCEANSSPGFKGLERSKPDLNVSEEIFRYVKLRLGFYKKRPALQAGTAAPE